MELELNKISAYKVNREDACYKEFVGQVLAVQVTAMAGWTLPHVLQGTSIMKTDRTKDPFVSAMARLTSNKGALLSVDTLREIQEILVGGSSQVEFRNTRAVTDDFRICMCRAEAIPEQLRRAFERYESTKVNPLAGDLGKAIKVSTRLFYDIWNICPYVYFPSVLANAFLSATLMRQGLPFPISLISASKVADTVKAVRVAQQGFWDDLPENLLGLEALVVREIYLGMANFDQYRL